MKTLLDKLLVDLNVFSGKRRGPKISRYVRYTRDVLQGDDFDIGEIPTECLT